MLLNCIVYFFFIFITFVIPSEFEIKELYKESVKWRDQAGKEYNIKIKDEFKLSEDTKLYGPRKSITILISDMIKNSLESLESDTKKNKELRLEMYEKDGKLNVEIYDTGKGIKKEHLDKIFGMFSHGKFGGTGKGLYFGKRLVERLGGKLNVDSIEGEYAKFTFYLDVLKREKDKQKDT